MPATLSSLYRERFGTPAAECLALPGHGSDRRYYRLRGAGGTVIGAVHSDFAENRAFIGFARHFRAAGLPVPEVCAVAADGLSYLQEDLGDRTLFQELQQARGTQAAVPESVGALYERVAQWLPRFQIGAARTLDFTLCYPRAAFDERSMQWDLNYFKYYFLRLARVPFDEQALEDDYAALIAFLREAPAGFFLYRDCQSRNVMLRDGETFFIDFQGGRRGALAYDVASLLLDAKANLPQDFRERILAAYLEAAARELAAVGAPAELRREVEPERFRSWYAGFSLIRLLQAMGAYGFRGFHEQKTHFLQSVPYAIRNLEHLLAHWDLPRPLPALRGVLERITRLSRLREIAPATVALEIRVTSFSYKVGYPADESGHGGGYVFDCRGLPNPGRDPDLAALSGRDTPIVTWLEGYDEVRDFLTHARALLHASVESYQRRNFTRLAVSFGCTGGRHRSVYCAEQTARWLRGLPHVLVDLRHRDLPAAEGGQAP